MHHWLGNATKLKYSNDDYDQAMATGSYNMRTEIKDGLAIASHVKQEKVQEMELEHLFI